MNIQLMIDRNRIGFLPLSHSGKSGEVWNKSIEETHIITQPRIFILTPTDHQQIHIHISPTICTEINI